MLKPLPDKEEFEREIRNLLNDGDIEHTARYLQVERTGLSKALNPDVPDRHNPFWQVLSMLWAFDAQRDGLAESVIGGMLRRRSLWLPAPAVKLDGSKATSKIGKEVMDLVERELAGATKEELLKEADDIKKAVDAKIGEILAREK